MKINYIFLICLLVTSNAFSQIGVQTTNPQKLFHIDGKSSSYTINPSFGVPSIREQIDDIVITNTGQIGISLINPDEKLDINGKLRIRDTEYLTGNNISQLFIDETGVVGIKSNLQDRVKKISVYVPTTADSNFGISINKNNLNNNLDIIVPIKAGDVATGNNTANTTVTSIGEIMINESGYYMFSGGITPFMAFKGGNNNLFLHLSIFIEVKKKGTYTWSIISGGRPIFERAGYLAPIRNQYAKRNYSYSFPTTVEILEPGDLIRIRMKRSGMGAQLDEIFLSFSYGAKPYVLAIQKL